MFRFKGMLIIYTNRLSFVPLVLVVLSMPGLILSLAAQATESSNTNPSTLPKEYLTIASQQAEINVLAATTTYSGDVEMKYTNEKASDQGSMSIDADEVVFREQEGTTTYSGNVVVKMDNGTARIEADQVIIHNNKRKVSKITATGKPARYEQKAKDTNSLVVARAKTLEYELDTETLRLIDNASLEQGGSSLSGNRIDWDARRSVVKAGASVDQKERVHMVIHPRALKQDPSPKTAPKPDKAEQ